MQEKRTYKIGYSHAFQIALESATTCFNIQEQNISRGYIKCTTKASLWSWGECVLITITSINSAQTEISAESSPSAQLFDWGKSKDNVDLFFNTLEQNIG
jgi:hypothetical protein